MRSQALRRVRRLPTLALAAGAVLAAPLWGQVGITVAAGVRYSTVLVHDQIGGAFDVRPALAPAFAVTASLPLDPPWSAVAVADFSTSDVRREDADGSSQAITRLSQATLGLGLRRRLKPWLSGSVRVGVLKYFPSQDLGLFQDGGPFFPFAQAAFDVAPAPLSRLGLGFELSADVHRFITDALRVEGFTDARVVGRIAGGVTWTPGRPR